MAVPVADGEGEAVWVRDGVGLLVCVEEGVLEALVLGVRVPAWGMRDDGTCHGHREGVAVKPQREKHTPPHPLQPPL